MHGIHYLALLGAVLAVSSSALFIRIATAPPLVIAAYRMLIVAALLLPVAAIVQRADLSRLNRGDMAKLATAGIFLAAHFGLWTASLQYTSVASSVVLVSTHPILVALLEAAWLGRRVPRLGQAGIALTVLGGVIVANDELRRSGANGLGASLALGGALAMVGYLLIGRSVRAHLGFIAYSAPVYAVCALVLVMSASITGDSFMVSGSDLGIFVALALVPTICGHTLFNWTLRHVPASAVATAFLGEPVGAAFLAWLLLSEAPGITTLAGGSVILLGLLITVKSV
ncbi:MAG: DMT family transporter [Chloroflexota bacterium]